MRTLASLAACSLFAIAVVQTGCGAHRTHAESAAALKSGDAGERRSAADELRDDGGPTPEGTRALLDAIKTETDDKAYGAMLISLGASGAAEAEPFICAKVYAPDARMRTYAKRAHKLYLEKNPSSAGCAPPSGAAAGPATTTNTTTTTSTTSTTSTPATAPATTGPNGVPIGPTK